MVDGEVSIKAKEKLGFLMFTLTPSVSQRTLFLSFEVTCRITWGWISSFWLYSISHSTISWNRCNDGVETRCLKGMLDKLGREKTWQTGGRLLDVFQPDQLLTRTAVPTDYRGMQAHIFDVPCWKSLWRTCFKKKSILTWKWDCFHWRILVINIVRIIA